MAGKNLLEGSTITVPPGWVVSFSGRGFCLDRDLPAPSVGEKFRLIGLDRMVHPRLVPVYQALSAASPRLMYPEERQHLFWALRGANDPRNPYAVSLMRHKVLMDKLDAAYPGASNVFGSVMQTNGYGSEVPGMSPNDLNKIMENMTRNLFSVQINGQSLNLMDLLDPNKSRQAVQDAMNRLVSLPVEGPVPSGDQDFTLLAPGIAARTEGVGVLNPRIMIANATDHPFVFDVSRYIAAPARKAQHVALVPPRDVEVIKKPDEKTTKQQKGEMTEILEAMEKFRKEVKQDLSQKSVDGAITPEIVRETLADRSANNPDAAQDIDRKGLRPVPRPWDMPYESPKVPVSEMSANQLLYELTPHSALERFTSNAIREGIQEVPVVGFSVSLYEAYTGEDIITGRRLDNEEIITRVAGTVPGAGIASRIVRGAADAYGNYGVVSDMLKGDFQDAAAKVILEVGKDAAKKLPRSPSGPKMESIISRIG